MIRRLTIAILIAALVGFAPAARAADACSANYVDYGCYGSLTLTGAPGTQFVVRAEQPDGSYAVVWTGMITLGPSQRLVAETGPTWDCQPQFIVQFFGPSGSETLLIEDPAQWYLE